MADRTASVVWEGDLASGAGRATFESSGFASDVPVSWPARTEEPEGQTSPEELLAAAHASCFCMALSKRTADRGAVNQTINASATVTFVPGTGITRSALTISVAAEGLTQEAFEEAVASAEDACPVSNALRGNVEISVDATLA